MGAWGITIFEDDYGLDFVSELVDDGSIEIILSSLTDAADEKWLESELASQVLVAGEMVAAALNRPHKEFPSDLFYLVEENRTELVTIADRLASALDKVQKHSELAELWEGEDDWTDYVKDIKKRIKG